MVFRLDRHQVKWQSQGGFTLYELLVVIFLTGVLATIVLTKFQALRESQEIQAGSRDLVSSIREVQNNVLTGKKVNTTQSARAYSLTFTTGTANYNLRYNVPDGNGNNTTSSPQIVPLSQNLQTQQILVGGTPASSVELRLEAPFGRFSVNGGTSELQITLVHTTANRTKKIIINPISGRVEDQ